MENFNNNRTPLTEACFGIYDQNTRQGKRACVNFKSSTSNAYANVAVSVIFFNKATDLLDAVNCRGNKFTLVSIAVEDKNMLILQALKKIPSITVVGILTDDEIANRKYLDKFSLLIHLDAPLPSYLKIVDIAISKYTSSLNFPIERLFDPVLINEGMNFASKAGKYFTTSDIYKKRSRQQNEYRKMTKRTFSGEPESIEVEKRSRSKSISALERSFGDITYLSENDNDNEFYINPSNPSSYHFEQQQQQQLKLEDDVEAIDHLTTSHFITQDELESLIDSIPLQDMEVDVDKLSSGNNVSKDRGDVDTDLRSDNENALDDVESLSSHSDHYLIFPSGSHSKKSQLRPIPVTTTTSTTTATTMSSPWFNIFAASKIVVSMPHHTNHLCIRFVDANFLANFRYEEDWIRNRCFEALVGAATSRDSLFALKQLMVTGGTLGKYINLYRQDNIPLSCHIIMVVNSSSRNPSRVDDDDISTDTCKETIATITIRSASVVGNAKFSNVGLLGLDSIAPIVREKIFLEVVARGK